MKDKFIKILLPFVPGNFILPAVVIWCLREDKNVLVWAFFAGLIADLMAGRTLGFSSLFYMIVVLVINFIKSWQKFNIVLAIVTILFFDFLYARF